MPEKFRLSLKSTEASVALIDLLRRHTGKPISVLRQAIANRQPILDESPHHNQYSDFIERTAALLDELDEQGMQYLIEVDGAPETSEYLRNVFQQWKDIREQTRRMIDLESGESAT